MRRLNSVDNMFLKQENPTQPQHTIKAVVLDPAAAHQPLSFETVRSAVPALVEKVEPLRWQLLLPRSGLGRPWWIERPQVDLDYHVKYATAEAPGGAHELSAQISEIVSVGLDRARPAWQLWYVDGLADGRIALVLKIHHAIADGLASVRLLETLFSADPAEPLPTVTRTLTDEQRPSTAAWLRTLAGHEVRTVARFPRVLVRSARSVKTSYRRRKAGLPGFVDAFAAPSTRFNEPFTAERRFAYTTCDLDTIKEIKSAFGVTLNDVFLGVCSGALRCYLERHGELTDESLTAVVPVAIRPPGEEVDWGNQVTTWFVSLATDVADPVERLKRIAANTSAARAVHAERDLWLFGDWMDYWPLFWFYGRALPLLGARTKRRPTYSMTLSNVPGPKKQLYFAGAPIETLISVGPIIYPYGLNVTGWSYLDSMIIAMQSSKYASKGQASDIWELVDGIPDAVAELAALAVKRRSA
ncbi:MAG TPA: wax ester/triacylglycerol synthase family O-acyltransferase [Mycobacterium sp.]|nr:wax ester/triacylglycerol synthase family O-acyltransferase [Mycobacterium sp.]